jgi:urease accessory protein
MSNSRELTFTRNSLVWLAVLLIWLWPQPAMAHVESGQAGGFLDGVHHPISGLDHVLAMVAVGLWGAQLGSPAVWLLPVAFPMMMAFGGSADVRLVVPRNRVRGAGGWTCDYRLNA